jgi:hypothetical protein
MLKYLKTKTIPKKRSKKKQKYLLYIILGTLWVIIVPILGYFVQVAPVLNSKGLYLIFDNGLITYFLYPVLSMIILFAGPVGFIIFIISFFQKLQRMTLRTVGFILLFNFIFCYGAGRLAIQMRNDKLALAAKSVLPVITGLQAYHAEYGKYPNALLDLIPKYLTTQPVSELLGYPIFEYERIERVSGMTKKPVRDDTQNTWVRFDTGGYELRFLPPINSSNFDRFIYWPKKIYPKYMYNGTAEPIDDWMYVRE